MVHFKTICRGCRKVMAQCNCIDKNKLTTYDVCDECKHHRGVIKDGEYHPSSNSALEYIEELRLDLVAWSMIVDSIAITALSGNEMSEILHETIRRIHSAEPVSDRYVLGLAWFLKKNERKFKIN